MFQDLQVRSVDKIMALMLEFQADPRDQKIDLVVGVYKDEDGNVPIMKAVKAAEERMVAEEITKTYVGMQGDADFAALVPRLLLGETSPLIAEGRVKAAQTPGGSGALKVATDLLKAARPETRVWMSTPTWANHAPIAQDAGLAVAYYPYFRASDRGLDFDAMVEHLRREAQPDDAILLHACCHNPTGVDPSLEQWQVIADLVAELELLPLLDCAYQGLGVGMEEDVAGLRLVADAAPELLIANSFSKNFGIYRERAGALTIVTPEAERTARVFGTAEAVIRSNYSQPPSHGARTVATVLQDQEMEASWSAELTEMRERIAQTRHDLRAALENRQVTQNLSFLTDQIGMFSYTGFTPPMVARLREEFGIYAMTDGRINIAAINAKTLDTVADAFAAVMR